MANPLGMERNSIGASTCLVDEAEPQKRRKEQRRKFEQKIAHHEVAPRTYANLNVLLQKIFNYFFKPLGFRHRVQYAIRGVGDASFFLRDNNSKRISFLGNADGGAVPRAKSV